MLLVCFSMPISLLCVPPLGKGRHINDYHNYIHLSVACLFMYFINVQQQNNWTYLQACRYVQEWYKKHKAKTPCHTSILTGHAWISKLYAGHMCNAFKITTLNPLI